MLVLTCTVDGDKAAITVLDSIVVHRKEVSEDKRRKANTAAEKDGL